ncbi:MAG: hypothetical protein ACMUIL_10105 [bacterium]
MVDGIHTESTFESAIVDHLVQNGWVAGKAGDFSTDLAFDKRAVLAFVQESQPREWERLRPYYPEDAEGKFIQDCDKELMKKAVLGDL